MTTLQPIPVTPGHLNGQPVQLVDARQLHQFLAVGRDFSTWIKGRIEKYGFEAGTDFVVIDSPKWWNQSGRGGDRRSIDYFLTLDMAKELAMVERTPRGRQARRYFIECERQLRQLQQLVSASASALPVRLSRAERQAINRQAWADVAGSAYAAIHARREALIRERAEANSQTCVALPKVVRPMWAM